MMDSGGSKLIPVDPDGAIGYIRTVSLRASQSGCRSHVDPGGSTECINVVSQRADQLLTNQESGC